MFVDYDAVKVATAERLFDRDEAGQPVYALADPEAIAQIASDAGLVGDPGTAFLHVVRATIALNEHGTSPLKWHAVESNKHRQNPLETPPSLPLLVVMTLAAERMQAGNDMAANNYYGRLFPLLDVPPARQERFIQDYRNVAETLWSTLNAWLEAWEGERGVPTAYSISGMRYVGLPMSQAVVRRHDREGLLEIFASEGLPPGSRVGLPDMELILDPYVIRQPSPISSNLRRLWEVPAARERIVQAACLELESWTGGGGREATSQRTGNATRLMAYVRTFPRSSVELNLSIPAATDGTETAVFETGGGPVAVPAVPGATGTARLASMNGLSAESLLRDVVTGHLGEQHPIPINRRPRRIFPLRWDELQGCFLEVERVALGEDNIVIAMADTKSRVIHHLERCARPGWDVLDTMPGLPDGWNLFRQVQIVAVPASVPQVELLPLVPRARTSLTLRGGFALPGRLRKWSSLDPPEAVALASAATRVSVRVFRGSRLADEDEVFRRETSGELAIINLRSCDLNDGEYTVAMYPNDARRPSSTSTMRLRSANTPIFDVEEADIRLVYSPSTGAVWPISAGAVGCADYINGPRVNGGFAGAQVSASAIGEFSPRRAKPARQPSSTVRLGVAVTPDSCLNTGLHRFQLPTAHAGRPPARTIEGECATCGLVKRFAATAHAARKRVAQLPQEQALVSLPPVVDQQESDQHVAFDALSHVGSGSYGVLERITGQIDGSSVFADAFLRRQEVLGNIDVRRDDTLQVVEWAVNAPTLVPIAPDTWVLIGVRSQNLIDSLRALLGGEATVTASNDYGTIRTIVKAEGRRMVESHKALDSLGVGLLDESPAHAIAEATPSLDTVEQGLRRIAIPSYRSLEIWDTEAASWTPATSFASTGAYRMRDFRSTYVVRSRADLDTGLVAIGTAQLVKHIANRWVNDPLIGYHTRSRSVVVPLGADLPGLYGRALSICSGRAPREIPDSRMVQYPNVPLDVANVVFDRLMN